MAPSQGLTTQAQLGKKKDKSQVSIVCAVNFTGTQRIPLWIIGKAAKQRALRGVNLQALNVVWKYNQKAWMTTAIMEEWLKAFYQSIEPTRSVLLLMDNFKAHINGVELQPPPANIRIQWLPPNATSLYQPLDQGIIQNFKHHYKKQWLHFMLAHYEKRSDPLAAINLYLSIRWAAQS